MTILGKLFVGSSKKTGMIIKHKVLLSIHFNNTYDYQKFLIQIYMKDYSYYKQYSDILKLYLESDECNLTEKQKSENRLIFSVIDAMYEVRDKNIQEEENKIHIEYQEFISSLLIKNKK